METNQASYLIGKATVLVTVVAASQEEANDTQADVSLALLDLTQPSAGFGT